MKYTLVHISDIHYREGWAEEVGVVLEAFFEDLREQLQEVPDPYLVVSGDLVAAGGGENVARQFVDYFSKRFDDVGLKIDRRMCVPGNHDVSREGIKKKLKLRRGSLDSLKGESDFNDNIDFLQEAFLDAGFESYRALEEQFVGLRCCGDGLSGAGHDVGEGLSVYLLNTALTSSCGLPGPDDAPVDDRGRLHVGTRSMHQWVSGAGGMRVLVMHHPESWLVEWAAEEIGNAVRSHFTLCLMGHTHMPSAEYCSRGADGVVRCVAPALFTKKDDNLGYAIVAIDTAEQAISVSYRQWSRSANRFVLGTFFAGNDAGVVEYRLREACAGVPRSKDVVTGASTLAVLLRNFEDSVASYSSKRCLWVGRDLSVVPETAVDRDVADKFSEDDFVRSLRSCVIRAPAQYGLSALARRIAHQHHAASDNGMVLLVVSASDMTPAERSLTKAVEDHCSILRTSVSKVAGFIFDDWAGDKHSLRVLREMRRIYPGALVIIMSRVEDCSQMGGSLRVSDDIELDNIYLWALDRVRIRRLTEEYVRDSGDLDAELVAPRLVSDLTALNMHRTPMNCLLLLRCLEERFDDTPVNRTAMIERVLFGLFHQFDRIPRYATRPDVKDCEFALGYLCETMIRGQRDKFTKDMFMDTVRRYSADRLIEIEVEVLFDILVSEGVIASRGDEFAFRFSYWLYYFAAHRMHHDPSFAQWVLAERRYAAFPELVEFYAGIDRQRVDAVERLTVDLEAMNAEFSSRTRIAVDFDPFLAARWEPGEADVERMREQVRSAADESNLPVQVKEAIADRNYDRSRPYSQELADFLDHSSLHQLAQGMRGSARALRNSDYVSPDDKSRLLGEVVKCWVSVCQVLAVLSPVLAKQRRAVFEDTQFYLAEGFDGDDVGRLWQQIMDAIVDNIVDWYEEDLFSKKMGPLLSRYVASDRSKLARFLVLLVMIRRRPSKWFGVAKEFLLSEDRHSFYMAKIYSTLMREYRNGFASERDRQQLLSLAAMAVARHELNVKSPNQKTIERVAKSIEKGGAGESVDK